MVALWQANIETLKGHDTRGGCLRRLRDRGVGGQCAQRRLAGINQLLEISAVIPLWIVCVVVELRGAGVQRHEQRFMEPAPVRDGLDVGLLGEHVGVAVGGLEGRQRAHHSSPVRAWRERCECHRALDVPVLVQRIERHLPEHRIGNLPGSAPPVAKPAADARKDREPITQRRIEKRGSQSDTFRS